MRYARERLDDWSEPIGVLDPAGHRLNRERRSGGSASASEIVAGALQDHRARPWLREGAQREFSRSPLNKVVGIRRKTFGSIQRKDIGSTSWDRNSAIELAPGYMLAPARAAYPGGAARRLATKIGELTEVGTG
jgi:hypothetical protein